MEDDYDPQHIERHVYQLLLLVQHILLALQTLYQLTHQCYHVDHHEIDEKDYGGKYYVVNRYKMMVHSIDKIFSLDC